MKSTNYKCDVCGREHTPTNGWYLIQANDVDIILQSMSKAQPADIDQADFHLCGRECLNKKSNELLDKLAAVGH